MQKSLTPIDIANYTQQQLLDLIKEHSIHKTVKPEFYLRLVETQFKLVGNLCENDMKLAMATQCNKKLIEALAGGGKTTGASMWLSLQKEEYSAKHKKTLQAMNILCLVFNKHNPKVMQRKHELLISRLKYESSRRRKTDEEKERNKDRLSPTLLASTTHSFALNILESRFDLLGLPTLKIDTQADTNILPSIIRLQLGNEFAEDKTNLKNIATLHELYFNNLVFDLGTIEEQVNALQEDYRCADLLDKLEITAEKFLQIKDKYYSTRVKFLKKMTYLDALVFLYQLLKNNKSTREYMHKQYPYIIIDEVQDFTTLMFSISKLLCNNETKLLCIGDGDQSIYGFRGATIDNLLNFDKYFPDGKIFQLTTNFRTSKKVLAGAEVIINQNKKRFPKTLNSIHDDGDLYLLPYTKREECNQKVVNNLKTLSGTKAVLYREQVHATSISFSLYKESMSYYTHNALSFFDHPAFTAFRDIIDLINVTNKQKLWTNLYKILPIKKDDWLKGLGYNYETYELDSVKHLKHWTEIDITQISKSTVLGKIWNNLIKIANNIQIEFCSQYIPYLLKKFFNDYWDRRIHYEKNTFILLTKNEVWDWIKEVYDQDIYLIEAEERLNSYIKKIKKADEKSCNICLTTVYGAKGLEYNNVIIPYLDYSLFPDYGAIKNGRYDLEYEEDLLEEENRVMYVAMTRTINNLYMHYNLINPSIVIAPLQKFYENTHIKAPLPFKIKEKVGINNG